MKLLKPNKIFAKKDKYDKYIIRIIDPRFTSYTGIIMDKTISFYLNISSNYTITFIEQLKKANINFVVNQIQGIIIIDINNFEIT